MVHVSLGAKLPQVGPNGRQYADRRTQNKHNHVRKPNGHAEYGSTTTKEHHGIGLLNVATHNDAVLRQLVAISGYYSIPEITRWPR